MIAHNTEVSNTEFVELVNAITLNEWLWAIAHDLHDVEPIDDDEIPFMGEASTKADDITVNWPEGWEMDEVPF